MDYIKFRTVNPQTPEPAVKKRLDMVPKTDGFSVFENIP
jgi:hypothetical protein